MKSICTTLYPNEHVGAKVSEYADHKSLDLPDALQEYHALVLRTQERSNYMISTLEAKFLKWLARSLGVKRVLEIGVYVGFSAMVWADAIGPDGVVTGLELSPLYSAVAETELKRLGLDNVEIFVGNALDSLAELQPSEPYDLIFIDANKGAYPAYLASILDLSQPGCPNRLLRKGGVIVSDNVLRSALVAERGDVNPASRTVPRETENWTEQDVAKLDLFNSMAKDDPRLESFLMPLFDGLGLARLLV